MVRFFTFAFVLLSSCARVASAPLPLSPLATRAPLDLEDPADIRSLSKSVTTLYKFNSSLNGSGSAFAFSSQHLLTAEHVCHGSDFLALRRDGSGPDLQVIYLDTENDLCILEGDHGLLPLAISAKPMQAGETIYIYGSPLGVPNILTKGRDAGRTVVPKYGPRRVASCQAFGGNSGGPVFNRHGQVVGVLVMGIPSYPQISYYTPLTVLMGH